MLELIPLSLLLLSLDSPFATEPLVAELELPAAEFVLGEPVHLTARVRNVSGESLTLLRGRGAGFRVVFRAERSDGLSWDGCREVSRGWPRLSVEQIPAGWKKEYAKTFDCLDEPGDYIVSCVAASAGLADGQRLSDGGEASNVWKGRVECADEAIRIVAPVGSDRAAFDYFNGDPLGRPDELARRFPTSTYAGHVLVRGGPWRLDPVAEVEMRGSYRKTAETDPEARSQMERLEAEQFALSVERALDLERYIEARPGFVYADFMRLELATRLAYIGDLDRARELCMELVEGEKGSYEAKKAAELLAHLE